MTHDPYQKLPEALIENIRLRDVVRVLRVQRDEHAQEIVRLRDKIEEMKEKQNANTQS